MRRWRREFAVCGSVTLLLSCTAGCGRSEEYELRGQVLAVDRARQEITLKHEDIRGFMPGMTMAFKVRDASMLDGRSPGELIRATLVVEESTGYLEAIQSVGRAPLTEAPPPARPDVISPGNPVPDVPFVDETGQPRTLSTWRNLAIAVTFTYTRCPIPDFCPAMDRRFADAQSVVLKDAALRGRVRLLSVSFDPTFDTPRVLSAHARNVGANPDVWSFLTGDPAQVQEFASRFGVQIMRDKESTAEIVHSLRTAVIDGEGRLVSLFSGNEWQASALIDSLRTTLSLPNARPGSSSGNR